MHQYSTLQGTLQPRSACSIALDRDLFWSWLFLPGACQPTPKPDLNAPLHPDSILGMGPSGSANIPRFQLYTYWDDSSLDTACSVPNAHMAYLGCIISMRVFWKLQMSDIPCMHLERNWLQRQDMIRLIRIICFVTQFLICTSQKNERMIPNDRNSQGVQK